MLQEFPFRNFLFELFSTNKAVVDTINFSNYSANQTINLSESSAGAISATLSSVGGLSNNMTIAVGTIIENAITGGGNDQLIGNSAGNILSGNGGNDTLYSGEGGADGMYGGNDNDTFFDNDEIDFDTIDGGAGNDWAYFSGSNFVALTQ